LKKIILSVFILISCFNIYPDEKTILLKRTIIIMPFVNQNKNSEYDFISYLLRDSLKARLMETNLFNLVNFSDVDSTIKKMRLNANELGDQNKSVEVGLTLKSDIVITGNYTIISDNIQINTNAIDVISNNNVVFSIIKGQVGISIFDLVEETAKDMAVKMSKEFPPVEQKILEEIIPKTDIYSEMNKNNLNPRIIAGIGLTSSGTTLILAGSGLLIYDMLGYLPVYIKLRDNSSTGYTYEDYVKSYNTFIGLTSASIGILSLGIALDIAGITLIVYKEKKKKVALIIDPKMDFTIGISYQF
jgi:hypothetical protein